MKVFVICNPTSGNGTGLLVRQQVTEFLKEAAQEAVFYDTERAFQATELALKALAAGAETVIGIGGDGTMHEIAQALAGTQTAFGIVPAGTGNDFVKTVHIPRDTRQALSLILHGKARPVDTVRINDRLFLNECGCGFDVMVLDYAAGAKKYVKGILPYLHGVIQTIFHYRSLRLWLSVDDGPEQEKNLLVLAVGNGRFIGGGIPIAPSADPDDGLLDLLQVGDMTKARMFSVLPGLLKGKIETFPETAVQRVRKLRLRGNGLRVNIDGEIITLNEADIEVKPASLLVYRP